MNLTQPNETCPAELPNFCANRHWAIFWILIICSTTVVVGRICTVNNYAAKGDSPFFSANDRSRWCTVRALGDHDTFAIDEVIQSKQAIHWDTIDKVRHVGDDGKFHFYSSKPTLFPTLLAYLYKGIKQVSGKRITEDTLFISRIVLLIVNGLPWAIYLYFLARFINAVPVRDWARYFVLACGGFGTYLSTFAISLNNHLIAAISVMIALFCLGEMWRQRRVGWGSYFACGLFSAFAAANELPALSFLAAAGFYCLIRSPGNTILGFFPAVILVAAGFFGTNYWAHGEWKPAYAHRNDGDELARVSGDFESELNRGRIPAPIRAAVQQTGLDLLDPQVESGSWPGTKKFFERWVVRDSFSSEQYAILRYESSNEFQIHAWNNWYDYPGSYWSSQNDGKKSDVDRGQSSREVYAFHVLFGHHGIFSLTPIWLISFAGMFVLMLGVKIAGRFQMQWLGLMGVAISIVVIAFYVFYRPAMDRNYGGVCSALRWAFWLAPIWLVSMLPIVDWLASSKLGRAICLSLLFLSALSAFYSMNNPWVNPWLYEVWDMTGIPK